MLHAKDPDIQAPVIQTSWEPSILGSRVLGPGIVGSDDHSIGHPKILDTGYLTMGPDGSWNPRMLHATIQRYTLPWILGAWYLGI